MIVAPGFIDPHTHMEAALTAADPKRRLIPMFLTQGVTTAFVGNDGGGLADVGPLLASWRTRPVGINYASYTGFGTIRSQVDDGKVRDYKAGEHFTEQPGAHHRVSENPSTTEPAKLLAIFVVDSNDKNLTTIDAK